VLLFSFNFHKPRRLPMEANVCPTKPATVPAAKPVNPWTQSSFRTAPTVRRSSSDMVLGAGRDMTSEFGVETYLRSVFYCSVKVVLFFVLCLLLDFRYSQRECERWDVRWKESESNSIYQL
jgi:hypothetical protein